MTGKGLPNFGEYKKKKDAAISEHKKTTELLSEANMPAQVRPGVQPKREITTVQVRS